MRHDISFYKCHCMPITATASAALSLLITGIELWGRGMTPPRWLPTSEAMPRRHARLMGLLYRRRDAEVAYLTPAESLL